MDNDLSTGEKLLIIGALLLGLYLFLATVLAGTGGGF